jgi:glycosyltransferase involved in cell wall biosynthesis
MSNEMDHISVCICTYRRPNLLRLLLEKLQSLKTDGLFSYSVIVVDNDYERSARNVILDIQNQSLIPIEYYSELPKSIPLTRNRAVQASRGNFIAFIDDDESPVDDWLLHLYTACYIYAADCVLGPVRPFFEEEPPKWITKGKLFERPSYTTGRVLDWDETRTGNVLMKRSIFNDPDNLFSPAFTHGEDKDFFRRLGKKGFTFVWCDEAPVYETQPPERFKRNYFFRRALLRGSIALKHQDHKTVPILKSAIAFTIYTAFLPLLFILGQTLFMKYLIKDCDHLGKLLSACKLDVQKFIDHP